MHIEQLRRQGASAAILLLGVLAAGCATVPRPVAPVGLSDEARVKFNTGRVQLVLTDWGGRPLNKARVDIESVGEGDYFRTAALSDQFGRVSFAGIPEKVRISVYHAESQGNYSREFAVPSIGTTELRMMIEPQ